VGFVVFGFCVLVVAAICIVRPSNPKSLAFLAFAALTEAGLLVWFVESDDPGVAGSAPRWDFQRGGATHLLFWVSVASSGVAVLPLLLALLGRGRPLGIVGAFGGALGALAGMVAGVLCVYGFTLS
jgi:hypothetical protein